MDNLKTETIELDGIKFTTRQFAAMRGFKLLAKLGRANTESGNSMAMFASLGPDEAAALVLDILADTTALITVDGQLRQYTLMKQDAVDAVFSGRLMTMFKVIEHALEVNFGSFREGSESGSASSPAPQVTASGVGK